MPSFLIHLYYIININTKTYNTELLKRENISQGQTIVNIYIYIYIYIYIIINTNNNNNNTFFKFCKFN